MEFEDFSVNQPREQRHLGETCHNLSMAVCLPGYQPSISIPAERGGEDVGGRSLPWGAAAHPEGTLIPRWGLLQPCDIAFQEVALKMS